jgi:hypothetical protein
MIDARLQHALETERTIDITTTGRATGRPHRIEMWFHNLDGQLYLTGTPGARSWHAHLLAHPDFVFQLKGTVRADLPARPPVLEPARRRTIATSSSTWGTPGPGRLGEGGAGQVEILEGAAAERKERA